MPDSSDSDSSEDRRVLALRSHFENALEDMIFKFQFDGLSLDKATDQVVERFKTLIQSAGGPVFDGEGYIPPMQTCTEPEVGRWFGGNDHRQRLLNRVHDHAHFNLRGALLVQNGRHAQRSGIDLGDRGQTNPG